MSVLREKYGLDAPVHLRRKREGHPAPRGGAGALDQLQSLKGGNCFEL